MADDRYLVVDIETDFDEEHPPEMPATVYNKCPECGAKSGEPCKASENDMGNEDEGVIHDLRQKSARQPSPPKSLVPFRAPKWRDRFTGGDRIVCAGTLYLPLKEARDKPEIHISTLEHMTEDNLVTKTVNLIDDNRTATLVTFNGDKFDMPFILTRSMLYDIPTRPLIRKMTRHNHIDLYYVLKKYQTLWGLKSGSLSSWCEYFGLTPDICLEDGTKVDGSMVHQLVADEKWDELERYNINDLLQTADLLEKCLELGLVEPR